MTLLFSSVILKESVEIGGTVVETILQPFSAIEEPLNTWTQRMRQKPYVELFPLFLLSVI